MHAKRAENGAVKMKNNIHNLFFNFICAFFLFLFFVFFSFPVCAQKPDLILAKYYNENIKVENYLISEKLDGIRAFWDGEFLYTRSGNKINAPKWFTADFPKIKLDGELWMGRGKFNEISSLVRRKFSKENNEEWKKVSYNLFELPEYEGDFKTRYETLLKIKKNLRVPWIFVIPQFTLKNKQELHQKLEEIVKEGGEGLMLHQINAPYVVGRSDYLLKLKPWKMGSAQVIAHIPGKGKLKGKVGALLVQDEQGNVFSIGSGLRNKERIQAPEIGAIIRFRFREYTQNQKPRFPVFLREENGATP